nr:MAG TPA: hypothetical protein [Caudoviricetes sp.]
MGCIAAGQNKSPAPSADARQKKSPATRAGLRILLVPFNHTLCAL